jgi:hypothetical protein
MDSFHSRNFYEFEFALVKLENCCDSVRDHLNDFEFFDMILWTPKSGKFIELCLKAGASFYKV